MVNRILVFLAVVIIVVVGLYVGNWAAKEGIEEGVGNLIIAFLCLIALALAGLYGLVWVLIFWLFPGLGARWLLLRTQLAGGELCVTWPGERVQEKLWELQKQRHFSMRSYTPRGMDDYTIQIRL